MLRVMSWNIRHGQGTDPATGRPEDGTDLEGIARVIEAANVDIVGLQEVDKGWDRSGRVDQVAWLADRLGMDVAFGPNLIDGAAEYGVATLSTHPIREATNVALPCEPGHEPRGCLCTTIDIPGEGKIQFLNTHLQFTFGDDSGAGERQRQAGAELITRITAESGMPGILVGDLNADPAEPALAAFRALQDAWLVAGEGGDGPTFPAHPVEPATHRIDAVFATVEWEVARATVIRDEATRLASDHYPVVAELRLLD